MYISDLFIPGKEGRYSILIEKDRIARVAPHPISVRTAINISIPGAIAFPGLINSHDHLDFNLFPRLGNRIYNNYTAWGRDIHSKNAAEIAAVLRVPQHLRTRWGLYKNLLNGFTTVVNHGEKLEPGKELISVLQDCNNLHSVGFEKNWRWKLNRPRRTSFAPDQTSRSSSSSRRTPFVLHVGEGTDAAAHSEIDRLIRWNLFKKPLIGVHGVAMTEEQAAHFKALVWCPDSNYFLLGRTAPVDKLKKALTLLFGTDSTLTSGWNGWDQVRLARKEGKVSDMELLEMLTSSAATVWGIEDRGEIAEGRRADLVIASGPSSRLPQTYAPIVHPSDRSIPSFQPSDTLTSDTLTSDTLTSDTLTSDTLTSDTLTSDTLTSDTLPSDIDAFYSLNPEDLLLVLHKGHVRLFDESLLVVLTAGGIDTEKFHPITIQGRRKYTEGDLPGLLKDIRHYHPEASLPAGWVDV
jgi:cytosine/adenosine deaminase-related metal-dependent hydrolase